MRFVLAMLLIAPASLSPAQEFGPAPFCPSGQCPALAGPPVAPLYSSSGSASQNLGSESGAIVRIANSQSNGRVFGSGTLVDVDGRRGLILTCAHLFRGPCGALDVMFPDAQTFPARLVKIDAAIDLAAVEIAPPRIRPIAIADNPPQPGDPLVSCGYGGDGRLWCNRGQALGYVTLVGGANFETLELTGSARSGDSGGPVLDRDHRLVAVLFGTDGRVVDGTFCGRVRHFLANLCPRLHARHRSQPAGASGKGVARADLPQIAPLPQAAPTVEAVAPAPPPTASPEANPGGDAPPVADAAPRDARGPHPLPAGPADSLGAAADQVGAVVEPWISARVAALLVSLGVPGGVAGVAAGAVVWLVMRRGKRRLQQQLDRLRPAGDQTTTEATAVARADDQQVIERHHNRYVAYETTALDKAWAAAHAHVGERYPGAVPYLKMAEGVKEQLLAGNKDPQIS